MRHYYSAYIKILTILIFLSQVININLTHENTWLQCKTFEIGYSALEFLSKVNCHVFVHLSSSVAQNAAPVRLRVARDMPPRVTALTRRRQQDTPLTNSTGVQSIYDKANYADAVLNRAWMTIMLKAVSECINGHHLRMMRTGRNHAVSYCVQCASSCVHSTDKDAW